MTVWPLDLWRCQCTCQDISVIFGPVKISVDLWRCFSVIFGHVKMSVWCQWTCWDVIMIFGPVERSVQLIYGTLLMSVWCLDLSWSQSDLWTCRDVSVICGLTLSRCQCDVWTCSGDVSVIFGPVEMSVWSLDLSRCQWTCGDVLVRSVDLSRCQCDL
jgi:hypothetical protein